MRPVVVLRHEEPDHLGCGRDVLTAAGLRVDDFDAWRETALPAPDDIAALVVLGGSMSVRDIDEIPFLGAERELVRECVRLSVPLLGLCLGAQLLAAALGGRVTRAPHRSIGFLPVATSDAAHADRLFGAWCARDRIFRWHEDTFTLPPGADLLLSAADVPNQAFRVGECAWGVQCHIELDRPLLQAWLAAAAASLPSEWNAEAQDIADDADSWLPHQLLHARQTFAAFASVVRERESERRGTPARGAGQA